MRNIYGFIARKLINQTNMLKNIEHKIKKHTKALSHLKHTNLQQSKENSKTPTPKNWTKKPKPKINLLNYIILKITKLTKLFLLFK